MNRRQKAYHLTMRSLFIALIIIQSYIPFLGYIPLGVINLTIIQITVIVASIVLGTKDGMLIGCIWGIVKLLICYTAPSSLMDTLVFRNPIITIIPRICVGLLAGISFHWIYQKSQKTILSATLSGIIGSLTNTIMLLSFIFLFNHSAAMTVYHVTTNHALTYALITIAATNGIPEMIASAIIVPLIVRAVFKATKLQPNRSL